MQNVADIVTNSEKTIREENFLLKHKYPINSLVEISLGEDDIESIDGMVQGLRLFVISHDRDCDGTPLYSLYSASLEEYQRNVSAMSDLGELYQLENPDKFGEFVSRMGVQNGWGEDSLKLISLPPERQ